MKSNYGTINKVLHHSWQYNST